MQQAQLGYREEKNLPCCQSMSSVTGAEEVPAFLLRYAQLQKTLLGGVSVSDPASGHVVQCLLNVY